MTALTKYQRLESSGLWRETPGAQRREVVVSVGEASLVFTDGRSLAALSHWSLPAIERVNPGELPAIYCPGPDSAEALELDDPMMIEAIETVRGALAARQPHPGRLRNTLLYGGLAAVVLFATLWMPGALTEHTAGVLPASKRAELGHLALADLARITGTPCSGAAAEPALQRLASRLLGSGGEIAVVRDGVARATHLPGPLVVLNRALIEQSDSPEKAAGYVLAEAVRLSADDPVRDILRYAGLGATLRLLTTGDIDAGALTGYGETLVAAPVAPVTSAALLPRFEAAGVAASPYAFTLDPTSELATALAASDPYRDARPAEPPLSDGEWVALQGICAD